MIPHHAATSFSPRFQIPPPTIDINPFMRVPSFQTIIYTLQAFTNTTLRGTTPYLSRSFYRTPQRATVLRSMPNITFLGALFGSSSNKMVDNSNYPVQKTEGEWQAQLSPGTSQSIIQPILKLKLTHYFSEQFRILRKKGTEAPGSGKYDKHYPDA